MPTLLETADAIAGIRTTYGLKGGDVFIGTLPSGDVDWVRVDLVKGETVTFGAVGLGGPGVAVHDPRIFLRSDRGGLIFSDDDFGPGLTPSLTYTADRTGSYFVAIRSLDTGTRYGLTMVQGDALSLDVEMGAGILYRDGLSWSKGAGEPVGVSWSFRATGPARDAEGLSAPFLQLSETQQAASRAVLGAFAEVSGLHLQQTEPGGFSNLGTIRIGAYTSSTDGAGAYAHMPGNPAAADPAGDIWLNTTSIDEDFRPGGYSWYALLHEFGHAMGLSHPGEYNAAPGVEITYAADAQIVQDSLQYTVMSYFDAVETATGAPEIYAQTLMMYDIRALQVMYGANMATHSGDTVYGFNATEAGSVYDFAANATPLLCIWDGGGVDALDLTGFRQDQRIDLRAGQFSDVGGFRNNVSIALDCQIENAAGGRGKDLITGNAADNRLCGKAGDDTITGGAGRDALVGGAGRDTFVFGEGDAVDRVVDFNLGLDWLKLAADLWGGLVKTATEVVSEFGTLRNGHVVLDFGADELHLLTLSGDAGLSDRLILD